MQEQVLDAARTIDLFLWIDAQTPVLVLSMFHEKKTDSIPLVSRHAACAGGAITSGATF
jgi:hypothetical protein